MDDMKDFIEFQDMLGTQYKNESYFQYFKNQSPEVCNGEYIVRIKNEIDGKLRTFRVDKETINGRLTEEYKYTSSILLKIINCFSNSWFKLESYEWSSNESNNSGWICCD